MEITASPAPADAEAGGSAEINRDARAALEDAKAAVELQDDEAAHRSLDRALRLCAAQSDAEAALVRTEATYFKGTLLYL